MGFMIFQILLNQDGGLTIKNCDVQIASAQKLKDSKRAEKIKKQQDKYKEEMAELLKEEKEMWAKIEKKIASKVSKSKA